jgi:hypothetical protein
MLFVDRGARQITNLGGRGTKNATGNGFPKHVNGFERVLRNAPQVALNRMRQCLGLSDITWATATARPTDSWTEFQSFDGKVHEPPPPEVTLHPSYPIQRVGSRRLAL